MTRRHVQLSACLVVVLVASACGSTNLPDPPDTRAPLAVPNSATPEEAQRPAAQQDAVPPTQSPGPASEVGDVDPTTATSAATPGTPPGTAPTVVGDPEPADAAAGPEYGPGVTDDAITIGLHVSEPIDEALAVFGAQSGSEEREDEIRIAQAVIDWTNANGGIAGRRIVPVFHRTDQLNGTFASQAQAACATFTEDNTVFTASTSVITATDQLHACLRKRGVPTVDLSLWPYDRPYYEASPGLLYQPGRMRGGRAARTYVDGLVEAGFFGDPSDPPSFALLRFDDPVFERLADEHLKPQLAAHGLELDDEIVFSTPQGAGDAGGLAAQSSNAIIRLRSRGVTHLLMLEVTGALPFIFTQEAESQGYRPTYGFSTNNLLIFQADQDPPAQLEGALAVGWNPPTDVYEDQNPVRTPAYERCLQVMRDSGQSTYGLYGPNHCDHIWFLKAALEAAPELTHAGLRAGVEALGTSYASPMAPATRFGPGRHDGADAYQLLAYDRPCECWQHTTAPRPAPR